MVEENEDMRCEIAKTLGDGITEMMKSYRGRVEEFFLQDLKPDAQRLEIEEVARVIITPECVEIYTFDDRMIQVSVKPTLKTENFKFVASPDGEIYLEKDGAVFLDTDEVKEFENNLK